MLCPIHSRRRCGCWERVQAITPATSLRPQSRISVFEAAVGGTKNVAASMQHALKVPVIMGAHKVVLVHNHPSGDPTPSPEDAEFTRRVAEVGAAIELPLLDHVILGRDGTFSFLDAGLLKSAG